MRNTITCGTLEQLAKVCAMLVPFGVTFEANAEYLTITLQLPDGRWMAVTTH